MADVGTIGYALPVTSARIEQFTDLDVQGFLCRHSPIIAKFCDISKQHFARFDQQTAAVRKKPINQVLSEALLHFMGNRWNQSSLAKAAGVAPNTVKHYLLPDKRLSADSGKAPSAKLTELEKIATALGLEVSDLITEMTDAERRALYLRRAADYYAAHGVLPDWAPEPGTAGQKQPRAGT